MTACAVVKLIAAGVLLAILTEAAALAAERPHRIAGADRDCTYRTHDDVRTHKHCARIDRDGHLHVVPRHLRRLSYDKNGLANIHVDRWYYVRRDGRAAPVMALDNWAEPFSDGRARSPVGKKVGYIDRDLRLVIPARYDGAFPFERGTAVVCTGCKTVSDGEHSRYEGGMWGCIDRKGRERKPFRSLTPNESYDGSCASTPPQHSGNWHE